MRFIAAGTTCFLALSMPSPCQAAEPAPQSSLEIGASTALSYDWLNRGTALELDDPGTSSLDHFPSLMGGFSLGYRYQPITLGAEIGFGRQLRGGELGSVSGGGFVALDLCARLRLRVHFFEQSISLQMPAPSGIPMSESYSVQLTGVGGGVDLGWSVFDPGDFSVQLYAGLDAVNLSREVDGSGSGPADARLIRGLVGLRVLTDTRLGYK